MIGGVERVLLHSSGSCPGQIPTIVIDMKSFAGGDDLSVLDSYLLCHVFFQQLKAGEVGWKPSPQVPRPEIEHKMEFSVADACIHAAKALRVLKQNGTGITYCHVSLIGIHPVLPVHADDLINLFLKIFPIGISFMDILPGGDQFFNVLFHIFHGSGRGDIASRRDVRDEGPCPGMRDLDNHIIIFEPLMTLETPAVDRIFVSLIKDIIDTLKPRIRQISCLNKLDLHHPLQPF
jgi:hypothetical protein